MWFLRQSTASQEIPLGPFLDSTDGNSQETALSIANTDIKLLKTGGTSESSKNSGGATHIAGGRYYAVLDATDTDTIGPMRVAVHVAGALAVWLDCCVLDEAVFDVLFGTTAPSTHTAAAVQALVAAGPVASVTGAVGSVTAGVTLAANQHVIVDSGTVTTLTNLPAAPTDWLTAAAVKADAVTKIQSGLSTYAGGDTSGTTTLLSRLTAARAGYLDNINNATLAGAAFPTDPADQSLVIAATNAIVALLGTPVGASIAADIATRLAAASYTAPPSAAAVASQVRTELGTELGRIDAAVSSRSTYAGGDTAGTTTLLTRVTGAVALATQIPAGFDAVTITSGILPADVKKVNAVDLQGNGTSGSPWGPA